MQDFTKSHKAANNNSTLQPARGKWLTKDRFWTFVFWFGMSLGLGLSLEGESMFSYCLFWLTIIGGPLLLKVFNGTKFIKTLTFANSEGIILTEEQRPYLFGWALGAGLPISFAVAEKILAGQPDGFFVTVFLLLSFFAPISLYFIYKDCPISILFNRRFWTIDGSINSAWLKKLTKIMKDN